MIQAHSGNYYRVSTAQHYKYTFEDTGQELATDLSGTSTAMGLIQYQ